MSLESTVSAENLRSDVGSVLLALRARALRILAVTVGLLVIGFLVLNASPRLYESRARLEVIDETTNAYVLISKEISFISSRDTLLAMADTLDLRSLPEFNGSARTPLDTALGLVGLRHEPASIQDAVLAALDTRLTVLREEGSRGISIIVRAADPAVAADIANALAAAAVGHPVSLPAAAPATPEEIDTLRAKLQEADRKVADAKAQLGIVQNTNAATDPSQQIADLTKQISDLQASSGTAAQRAALIRSLIESDQSVDGIEEVRSSAAIQALMQTRATLQASLAEKSATLLPAHPTIKLLKTQIAQISMQVATEARHIADGLDAQAQIAETSLKGLSAELAKAQKLATAQTTGGVSLDTLVRDANALRERLAAALAPAPAATGQGKNTALAAAMRIAAPAVPSDAPVTPNTLSILGLVAIGSLGLQIGLVLLGQWLSARRSEPRDGMVTSEGEEPAPSDGEDANIVPVTGVHEIPMEAPPAPQPAALESIPSDEDLGYDDAFAAAPLADDVPLDALAREMEQGRLRWVLVAGIESGREAALMTDLIVDTALRSGLSVCRIDAGSLRPTPQPGLTDLCADAADYGDVVHRLRDTLAEVPWGRRDRINARSDRAVTLVAALGDIYEVIVVSTGKLGVSSSLPLFAGLPARVLLTRASTASASIASATEDIASLGFSDVEVVDLPFAEAAVA